MNLNLPDIAPGSLIAHRGASINAPENTLAAYRLAAESGFDWIEVDTQLSRDGVAVMMHDFTIDRTTSGAGHVCDLTLEWLKSVDASPNHSIYTGETVPTLEETIALCLSYDMGLVLEIKPIPGSDLQHGIAVAEIVNRLWPRDNSKKLVVSSFSGICLQAFRQIAPWVSLALACEVIPENPESYIEFLGISSIHMVYHFALKQDLTRLLGTGMQLVTATVNQSDIASQLFGRGVHALMTDRIGLFA